MPKRVRNHEGTWTSNGEDPKESRRPGHSELGHLIVENSSLEHLGTLIDDALVATSLRPDVNTRKRLGAKTSIIAKRHMTSPNGSSAVPPSAKPLRVRLGRLCAPEFRPLQIRLSDLAFSGGFQDLSMIGWHVYIDLS
jgi:hypothetical protein